MRFVPIIYYGILLIFSSYLISSTNEKELEYLKKIDEKMSVVKEQLQENSNKISDITYDTKKYIKKSVVKVNKIAKSNLNKKKLEEYNTVKKDLSDTNKIPLDKEILCIKNGERYDSIVSFICE